MDRRTLSRIDDELDSSEVAALCFLCSDVVNRKRLETIEDAKGLFIILEGKGLLDNHIFLSQLLHTIRRADLLSFLENDTRRVEETDANPVLSDYRVMLYQIYEDLTKENLNKLKFLMSDKLGWRKIEKCKTALDVFTEMEKAGLLSSTHLKELHEALQQSNRQLALTVQQYIEAAPQHYQTSPMSHVSMDYQTPQNPSGTTQPTLSVSESQPSRQNDHANEQTNAISNQADYYHLSHNPRGLCVIFNNEEFIGTTLRNRSGTQQDEKALRKLFTLLGFTMVVHNNLTAAGIRNEIKNLGTRNFFDDDALVICVLSHGEKGCIYGTDEKQVYLRELTQTFTSNQAPTLAGKPKLFFIQACQGSNYQGGAIPHLPTLRQEEMRRAEVPARVSPLEEDAGPVESEMVPWDADFLLGMATVEHCKSFRHTSMGSIYIQALCRQLQRSALSTENDDILAVLTRVNREVSRGSYLNYKQMPEPKYTLTKKLVLKCVRSDEVQS